MAEQASPLFEAPATEPYPAKRTGPLRFDGSGTDETYADTGSSAGGMTLTQQLGTAAPLTLDSMAAPISFERKGPNALFVNCAFTVDVGRGTTYFDALGTSLA